MTPNLKKMSTADLFAELDRAFAMTADGIKYAAPIFVELENRGADLKRFRNPMTEYFPAIAAGRLMPQLVLSYCTEPETMRAVAGLTAEDQKRLVLSGGTIQILDAGRTVPRVTKLENVTRAQLRQVIGDGRIRTPDEQRPHVPPARPVRHNTFDLAFALSSAERKWLEKAAKDAGITPAAFVVAALRAHNGFQDAPRPRVALLDEKPTRRSARVQQAAYA